MPKRTDIIVIGGGPAGVVCAVTARKYYPGKSIMVIKDVSEGVIPCGIPYMFASLNNPDENKLGMAPLEKNNVELVVDRALKLNRKEKTIETESKNSYVYEKLVLAVGSIPLILPIKGIDKQGVYPINKEMGYLKGVIEQIKRCKNVLVIGGGFIGVEFADELSKLKGVNVTLVEMLPHLLANSFDTEFSQMAEARLKEKGVVVLTNTKVEEIIGQDKVEKVRFSDGREIPVEGIILGAGSRPNVKMAVDAGLEIGACKGILTDEYMRASVDPDIFAIGDCACKRDFYTRKAIPVMLASTATAEARIAGANLYQIKVIRENKGTIAIYSTYIDGLVLGSAGLTERTAREEGFEIVVGSIDGVDKHPATLPGACKGKIKLIFSKQSGIILGGQVSCGMSCAQMINIIGVAIQKRMSATELETLQVATHPYLTSAPTMFPIVLAAQDVYGKI
ncbi:MAG: FAD-dependent oxidoreductase [Candidatus Omnitrophica bacterium]|nr:FAD-dependent oxidoreductase [Candidatus Omnitrophota bacterium]MDD5655131.1 FAD-dependent oxidoreductase [Candidatus Omnitrophota bacterium]